MINILIIKTQTNIFKINFRLKFRMENIVICSYQNLIYYQKNIYFTFVKKIIPRVTIYTVSIIYLAIINDNIRVFTFDGYNRIPLLFPVQRPP